MKLIYVLSLGHSGSTLIDCILGTHPDFCSSGELRYLNWQLERTKNTEATVEDQNICTCNNNFRDCGFWSKVFSKLKDKTGHDIITDPCSFDTAYFKQFSYQNQGGFARSPQDKIKGFLVRKWIEQGWSYKKITWLERQIPIWLANNWILYETMTEVSKKPFVVDSSKHLTIALLLQQYRPQNVTFLFVHRKIEGLASSAKRWSKKQKKDYSLTEVVNAHQIYNQRVISYKKNIPQLSYIEIDYENLVRYPADFLDKIVKRTGANSYYRRQENNSFYIDPSQLHIVAGNPMRYKGERLVQYDERWKTELSEDELSRLKKCI